MTDNDVIKSWLLDRLIELDGYKKYLARLHKKKPSGLWRMYYRQATDAEEWIWFQLHQMKDGLL